MLGLPIHLADRKNTGLLVAYEKYKAHLQASQTYEHMQADGTWTERRLSSVDLIELFAAKSYFHSYHKKIFGKISDHPLMTQWLEGGEEKPSNLEIWGVDKPSYTFLDLQEYLQSADGSGKKDKGKKKMKDEGGSKKKKGGGSSTKKQVK